MISRSKRKIKLKLINEKNQKLLMLEIKLLMRKNVFASKKCV